MRIGLIGAGRIGTYHARILAEIPEVTSLLIADIRADLADELAASVGAGRAAASPVDDILTSADAVVIASSTDTHADLLQRAAAAGLSTFCEKPIAVDLPSTRAAVEAIDEAGIDVLMGFQRRYDPAIRSIRDRVASGELGVPYLVRSQTHDPAPPPLEYIPHSGGIFKDCLIHDIDVVRYVTGQEVVSVDARGSVVGHAAIAELGDFGSATAVLQLEEGTLAQLSGLRHDAVGYDVRLEVFAPGSSLGAGWSPRTPIHSAESGVAGPEDPIMSFWDRFHAAYVAEMQAFVRVVLGDEAPASDHHDAYEALRIATACALAANEQRSVRMEEVE